MEEKQIGLNVLAEKTLQTRVNPDHLRYCPTMDLLALATESEDVQVFRLNGQKVFTVSNKSSNSKITGIQWKPNGLPSSLDFTPQADHQQVN